MNLITRRLWCLSFGALAAFACSAQASNISNSEAEAAAKARTVFQQARAGWPAMFHQAYAQYPDLPAGVLEAIAYAQTGWRNVAPDEAELADPHMPAAYGPMGLYAGGGFADQVGEAAKLTGFSAASIMRDPETNILAGAALLDRAARQGRGKGAVLKDEASLAFVLQRYAGFGPGDDNVNSYARESFAYEVLQTLDRGVQADGVEVPRRRIDFSRAFAPDRLELLRAPEVTLNADRDTVEAGDATPQAGILALDYGPSIWNPASPSNYSTAWNTTSAVILHTMEGSYAGAISWFKNPSAQVSAHYLIRKSDGQVTQMVRETHQAWHAKYHNHYTIGIEHDGYASDPGNWSTAMVNASAALTRSICQRRGVNCASAWRGPGYAYWNVVPDSVRVKGHGMLTSNQDRYDPGQYFPWSSYYSLINGGAPPPPPPAAAPRYWVDIYANAPGFASATSTTQTGTLYQGTNYVYCKTWGREIRNGNTFNRWWLKTDLDVGPANQWVSAYYLSRWGNDEARDNDGYDLPRCEVLPYGKIGEKYYAMGGVRSHLGVPRLAEMAAKEGGRFQEFVNGIILWHARTGAFAIHGDILRHFWATGDEGRWGYPKMDEMAAARSPASGQTGRYQYFEQGLFLWTPATGAHAVHGAILAHFETNGREARFGYPKTDEQPHGSNGRKQVFEKGTFYWTPQQGVWVQ